MCVCVCVCVCCAFVGLDNKLYKMHGMYIKIIGCNWLLLYPNMARDSGCRMVDVTTLQPSVHLLATILFNIVFSDSSNHRLTKDSNQRLQRAAFHDTTRRNPEPHWNTTNLCNPGLAAVRNRNADVRPMATVQTHTVPSNTALLCVFSFNTTFFGRCR